MEQRILGFARRNVKRALGLLMALMLLFGLLPAVSFAAYTIGPNPSTYAARPDQNTAPRPAYLAGSFFSTPGAGLVVYDAAGDRKVIPFTNTSSDWNTSKLLMDCVSSDWGYYRVTLYLPAGGYQFKVYQENAVGGKLSKVSADKWNYWFGLDGYIYSKWDWDGQYPWPGTDIYNNDPTGGSYGASADYNNVHIDLVEPDDVTFYFIDGTRSDFLEYAPNPSPWYANDNWRLNTTLDPAWGINGGRDARNAQIHYIAAYPEKQINRGPANDPDVVGLYDHFDWYRTHYPYDGSAHDRFRPFSTPFWFGIKRTMKSDTITSDTGIATGVRGDMFLFRRTDFLATGGIGNNDGGKAYYKNNTGDYYSNIVNSPYANISNPNGTNATTTMSGGTRTADGLRMDLWSSHATQLVDAAGNATNDMYFGSAVSANVAGVYTYYMDKVRFGKVGSSITEPYVNEAYDFTQGPRARYQAVYLPTIVLNTPPTGLNDESPIRFTGDSYGYNTDANTSNIVYGKLMGTTQTHYADMDMVKFGALQALVTSKGGTLTRVQNGDHADITLTFTTNASAANGEWQWPADGSTITLPKSEVGTVYTLDAYLEVVSTERLLDGKTLDSSGNEKWARNYSTAMSTYGANIQGTGDSQSIEGFINSLPAVNYATVNASAELATQHVFPHAGTVVSSDGKTHTRSSIETKTLTVVNRAPTVTGGVATGNKTLADTVTINVPTINITSTELDIWSGDADKPIIGLTTGTYTSPLHSYSVTVGALSGGVYPVRVGSNHIANIRLNTNANGVVISATLERVYRTSGIGVDSVPDFTVPLTVTDGWLSGANGSLRFRLDNQAPETDPADHYRKDGQSTTSTMHTDVQARDVKDNDPTGGDSVTVTSYSVSSSASVQRSCNATGTPNTALWTTIASYALNTGVNAGLMDFTVPSNIWYYNGSTWSPQDASWIGGAVLAGGGYSTMGIPVATPTQLANTVVFDLIVINVAIIDNDAFNPLSSSDPIRIHYGPAPTIDVNVTKVWAPMPAPAGITHPTSVQVQLLRDGDPYGDPVTLNSGNSWYHEWTELDPAFTWTVEEVSVPDGYTVSYGGDVTNGFIVTNTKTTDFTVVKEWQPSVPSGASVTFQLTKGGLDVPGKVITLSSAPWTHTWTDLPYGTDYGVRETAFLPGSYASAIGTPVESPVGSGNYTVTVTNTERPGSLVISKVVADENDTGTFTFTVKKNNVAVDLTATGIVITPSGTGTYTATALSSGTFTMTRDTTVTITGLTPGTDYTVTEVATGYTTTFNVNGGTESGSTT
ncbi:MAG: Cna B-type domain-containing protein, partial [Clostridiales bacterium]|nr:Cna B-type domain-containing protein [Clostridiales bacterium]